MRRQFRQRTRLPRSRTRTRAVFRFGADLREGYLRNREAHFATVTASLRANDVLQVAARIEQAPGEVLRQWLRQGGRR